MKSCYKCGQQLPDEAVFCNKCGARLEQQTFPSPSEAHDETGSVPADEKREQPHRRKRKRLPVMLVGLLVLAFAGAAWVFYHANLMDVFNSWKGNDQTIKPVEASVPMVPEIPVPTPVPTVRPSLGITSTSIPTPISTPTPIPLADRPVEEKVELMLPVFAAIGQTMGKGGDTLYSNTDKSFADKTVFYLVQNLIPATSESIDLKWSQISALDKITFWDGPQASRGSLPKKLAKHIEDTKTGLRISNTGKHAAAVIERFSVEENGLVKVWVSITQPDAAKAETFVFTLTDPLCADSVETTGFPYSVLHAKISGGSSSTWRAVDYRKPILFDIDSDGVEDHITLLDEGKQSSKGWVDRVEIRLGKSGDLLAYDFDGSIELTSSHVSALKVEYGGPKLLLQEYPSHDWRAVYIFTVDKQGKLHVREELGDMYELNRKGRARLEYEMGTPLGTYEYIMTKRFTLSGELNLEGNLKIMQPRKMKTILDGLPATLQDESGLQTMVLLPKGTRLLPTEVVPGNMEVYVKADDETVYMLTFSKKKESLADDGYYGYYCGFQINDIPVEKWFDEIYFE